MYSRMNTALLLTYVISPLLAQQSYFHSELIFHAGDPDHHHHRRSLGPCSLCDPPHCCTPLIQCPPFTRPDPVTNCWLRSEKGRFKPIPGVCCTLGYDKLSKRSVDITEDQVTAAHIRGEEMLKEWQRLERNVLDHESNGTIVVKNSPSHGHYLSMRSKDRVKEGEVSGRGLRTTFTAQALNEMGLVSNDKLHMGILDLPGVLPCRPPPSCGAFPHRHINGECNNRLNPTWGAARTPYERILPASYDDGIWSFRKSVTGAPLPSPRSISASVFKETDSPSKQHNLILSQFGQFLVHDITGAIAFNTEKGPISCCSKDGKLLPPPLQHGACAPVLVSARDAFYSTYGVTCINFVRSQLAPSHDCSLGPAKQMNSVTHYADLSPIYGSTESKLSELRDARGRMRTFSEFGRQLPPLANNPGDCLMQDDGAVCFESGDHHINQMISLVSIHTLFIREHNRLAETLAELNPAWTDDQLFLEARRILIAEYQHIIFNEWLPLVIGRDMMAHFRLAPAQSGDHSADYDEHSNPGITSELAAAALRFGHSTMDSSIRIESKDKTVEEISIPEVMFQPARMRLRQFHDRMLRGLSSQPMQRSDNHMSQALTTYMFHGGQPFGTDLASINIQRGRDHGLNPYNEYRKLLQEKPFKEFSQYPAEVSKLLSSVYSSPDDVDLWVGGLLEPEVAGGVVGPTFAHIIADQFSRMRRGDRFFYEHGSNVNDHAFTNRELAEIKKMTMSRLICEHSDHIELVEQSPHAFLLPHVDGNARVSCDDKSIPKMDFSVFRET